MTEKNETSSNKKELCSLALINKIYQSFEALEQTLGALKLEEPLFITYAAKKSFAASVFKKNKHKPSSLPRKNVS